MDFCRKLLAGRPAYWLIAIASVFGFVMAALGSSFFHFFILAESSLSNFFNRPTVFV